MGSFGNRPNRRRRDADEGSRDRDGHRTGGHRKGDDGVVLKADSNTQGRELDLVLCVGPEIISREVEYGRDSFGEMRSAGVVEKKLGLTSYVVNNVGTYWYNS